MHHLIMECPQVLPTASISQLVVRGSIPISCSVYSFRHLSKALQPLLGPGRLLKYHILSAAGRSLCTVGPKFIPIADSTSLPAVCGLLCLYAHIGLYLELKLNAVSAPPPVTTLNGMTNRGVTQRRVFWHPSVQLSQME